MIKTLIRNIKVIVQATKEAYVQGKNRWIDLEGPFIHKNILKFEKKLSYIVCDAACLKFFNVPSTIPFAGVVLLDTGEHIIVVNTAFNTLPEYVQIAILFHEAGHIVNEDKRPSYYFMKRFFGHKEILVQEFNADAYSQRMGCMMYEALQYLHSLNIYNNTELEKRIENLRTVN